MILYLLFLHVRNNTCASRVTIQPGPSPAKVHGQGRTNLLLAGIRILFEKCIDGHNKARSAESALHAVTFPECLLHGMQLASRREALDGGHLLLVGLHREHQARAYRFAVNEHRTRAADAMLAAKMGSGESQVVAQEVCQRATRLGQSLAMDAIDSQFNHLLFACHRKTSPGDYWARCAASVKARRTRLVAT